MESEEDAHSRDCLSQPRGHSPAQSKAGASWRSWWAAPIPHTASRQSLHQHPAPKPLSPPAEPGSPQRQAGVGEGFKTYQAADRPRQASAVTCNDPCRAHGPWDFAPFSKPATLGFATISLKTPTGQAGTEHTLSVPRRTALGTHHVPHTHWHPLAAPGWPHGTAASE